MATADAVSTLATEQRSVKAACEYLAVAELAPGLYLVDNGEQGDDHEQYTVEPDLPACTCDDWEYRSDELGDDGCKHIRRVRMYRGEIDIGVLLETDARVDPLLRRRVNGGDSHD